MGHQRQNLEHLRAEVEFRKKLAIQHVTGKEIFSDYYQKNIHDTILLERVKKTNNAMQALILRGISLSPFIEIGAERGQRALVLANYFNAQGFACDLSFEQLRTMDHWKKHFNMPTIPYRVCCDANKLPFVNNAFTFAFSYEFLHHFPTPLPIVAEIHRILGTGHYYSDEEGFGAEYRSNLFKIKRNQTRPRSSFFLKILYQLSKFFIEYYTEEEEQGIIENDSITLNEWIKSYGQFSDGQITIRPLNIKYNLGTSENLTIKYFLNRLFGGGLSALCIKKTCQGLPESKLPFEFFACPSCMGDGGTDRSNLIQKTDHLKCEICGDEFPIIDNIFILLPRQIREELYPEFM